MNTRRLLLTLSVIASSLHHVTGAAGQTGPSSRTTLVPEVVFNMPTGPNKRDSQISERIIDWLGKAADGSSVYVAMYSFNDKRLAQAMATVFADPARQLRLYLVAGSKDRESPKAVKEQLRKVAGAKLTFLKDHPGGRMNHSKFILFEKFKSGQYQGPALAFGSSNFSENEKHNHFVLVALTDAAYRSMEEYWKAIESGSRKSVPSSIVSPGVEILPSPRSRDPIATFIRENNTKSSSGAKPASIRRIGIVTPRWRERTGIVASLDKLTDVKITIVTRVYGRFADDKRLEVDGCGKALFNLANTKTNRTVTIRSQKSGVNIHSKYVVIDLDGVDDVVFSGSPNFTEAALDKHWELLVKITEPGVVAEFWKNLAELDRHTEAHEAFDPLKCPAAFFGR